MGDPSKRARAFRLSRPPAAAQPGGSWGIRVEPAPGDGSTRGILGDPGGSAAKRLENHVNRAEHVENAGGSLQTGQTIQGDLGLSSDSSTEILKDLWALIPT